MRGASPKSTGFVLPQVGLAGRIETISSPSWLSRPASVSERVVSKPLAGVRGVGVGFWLPGVGWFRLGLLVPRGPAQPACGGGSWLSRPASVSEQGVSKPGRPCSGPDHTPSDPAGKLSKCCRAGIHVRARPIKNVCKFDIILGRVARLLACLMGRIAMPRCRYCRSGGRDVQCQIRRASNCLP